MRTRPLIAHRFEAIRKLRNAIFHFRKIWHRPNLLGEFDHLVEALGWMDPNANRLLLLSASRARISDLLSKPPSEPQEVDASESVVI